MSHANRHDGFDAISCFDANGGVRVGDANQVGRVTHHKVCSHSVHKDRYDVARVGRRRAGGRVDLVTLRGVRWERELRHIVLARGGVFHAGGWHLVDVHGLVVEVVRMVDDVRGVATRAVTLRRSVSMGQEAI